MCCVCCVFVCRKYRPLVKFVLRFLRCRFLCVSGSFLFVDWKSVPSLFRQFPMCEPVCMFEQINERNIIFTQKKEDNATTRKREQIIHGINASVMEYHDMYSKLKQGKQFYGDLRLRVDQLKQTVSGHVHGRALEAREVLLNIQRQDGMARQMETGKRILFFS